MPRRTDLSCVLVIGSGPIVIGQACEFDYSGTQACRVLKAEGLRTVLVNSNPATIMTDPEFADATYVEPITPEFLAKVIARERPDALLPTLGGQTALNATVDLARSGVLARYGVELIGADLSAIESGEDRERFKEIVATVGASSARSRTCHSVAECEAAVRELGGYPVVLRPSFTMGGAGSGLAHDSTQLREIARTGLDLSSIGEVLVEESVLGWKEYELELMRDRHDNVVVVCSIENVDPMGVHTGDSVTVAPAMTLTDREYQHMRDVGIAVLREVGVDTGGCNIQFAINPADGRMVVIEMNPRVSRSSALASKATGFPIAKIAARLAIGYTLDEIRNDITGQTPASFEPALDYVVVKVPRFAFEKFPGADPALTTTMKSVGEAMSIGRNFAEALQKALRSLDYPGAELSWATAVHDSTVDDLVARAGVPAADRLHTVLAAIRAGASLDRLAAATRIDPWFLDQLMALDELATEVAAAPELSAPLLRRAKRAGFADRQLAELRGTGESGLRALRHRLGVRPVFKTVDTCAAEFAATTPYHYSSYDEETEVAPRSRPAVLILGSGPNRIGQGIEFDYSCVHAAIALREAGYETVMVNCNPETVSTDYDTSDRLYFEPLTFEDVLEVVHAEQAAGPVAGVIVQLGGQTPLALAQRLADAGVPIVGTPPEAIHLAEDRASFARLLAAAGVAAPRHGVASSLAGVEAVAERIGYPVMVRPSYVLGGRGMELARDAAGLRRYLAAADVSTEHPVLVDEFLADAVELDVEALYDGTELFLGGILEHVEAAGVHSGDSACVLPPCSLTAAEQELVRERTETLAAAVGVRGLLNIQFALAGGELHVLEVNPRASRTVPFVAKVTGVQLAKAAARIALGTSIARLRAEGLLPEREGWRLPLPFVAVKEAVLPWQRFRDERGLGVDTLLGPEMRSTGEVMGVDADFGGAFAKAQAAAGGPLPGKGRVLLCAAAAHVAGELTELGFDVCTDPEPVRLVREREVDLVVSIADGTSPEGRRLRAAAVARGIPCVTTVRALAATVRAIRASATRECTVRPLQELHMCMNTQPTPAPGAHQNEEVAV